MPASRLLFGIIIMSEMWWDVRRCWETHSSRSGTEKFAVIHVSMFWSGGRKGRHRTKCVKIRAQIRRTKEFCNIVFLIP